MKVGGDVLIGLEGIGKRKFFSTPFLTVSQQTLRCEVEPWVRSLAQGCVSMRLVLEGRVSEVSAPVLVTVVDSASKSGPQLSAPGNSNEVLFIVPGVLLSC